NEQAGSELIQILSDLELVKHGGWDYKFTDINDTILTKLIYVQCYSVHHYNLLLKALHHDILRQRIQKTYNTKLSHLYRYIFENLPNNPMAKMVVEHDNGDLISISRSNDRETLGIPFSLMYVNVNPTYSQGTLDGDDPIESIRVKIQDETIDFTGHESD